MKLKFFPTLLLLWAALAALPAGAQVTTDVVVPITVATSLNPARITLSWPVSTAANITLVGRKTIADTEWTLLTQLPGNVATYTDAAVTVGAAYEYVVLRQGPPQAIGIVYAGIQVAPVLSSRGRFMLLIDNTLSAPLAMELARFEADLRGDGWLVERRDISPTTSTVASVKTLFRGFYDSDPASAVAGLVFGNLPVPYSGNINPDGHADHLGAWPTDYYYGDMDEAAWTDASVNNSVASRPANRNVPGDGKFDQSQTPTLPEIVVSRVDFSNLTNWSVSQTELYRRYLNKDHNFRTGAYKPENKTLVDDNFGYFGGEAFAQNGWRNGYALAGAGTARAGDFFNDTDNERFLVGYGCGGGTYTSASGVGNSDNFKTDSVNVTFAMLFGSYFGDWDYEDNPFMPSALSSKGGILTCSWAGRPNWHLHHMGLGEPMLWSAYWTWLNSFLTQPAYPPNYGADLIHVGMLGDPTLRAHAVQPPTNVVATANCTSVHLAWDASPDAEFGYLIYRAGAANGDFELLTTTSSIDELFFDDTDPLVGANYYQVKALKLELTPTGSYYNQSVGIGATAQASSGTLSATAQSLNPVCSGTANGNINVDVSGTATGLSFNWSNGATTQNLSGLAPGTYTVTVTSVSGCVSTASATVASAPSPSVSVPIMRLNCFGDSNGTLTANVTGGTMPYQYQWSNFGMTQTITGLVADNYDVLVIDANGCTATKISHVYQPTEVLLATAATASACFGGQTGSIVATISGGTPGYSFAWSNGATTQNLQNLAAGNYALTATDQKGCSKTTTATVGQGAEIVLQTSSGAASCNGGTDGSATIEASGGVGNFTYQWSNGETTAAISDIAAGIYTATATDAAGCSKTTQVTVNQNSSLDVGATLSDVICHGFANGSISMSVSGGTPGYVYQWSNGATEAEIFDLDAGVYTATVTDAGNCQFIQSFTVQEPPAIAGDVEIAQEISCANSSDGELFANIAGGTGALTFSWNDGAFNTQSISGLSSGLYRLTVTDAAGCEAVFFKQMQAPSQVNALFTLNVHPSCKGAGDGQITADASGGTPPYAFAWSNGATGATISGLSGGDYIVTVTDANGCAQTAATFLVEPSAPEYTAFPTLVGCFGSSDGSINGSTSLGFPPYTYLWSNGATTEDISSLSAGTYTVTVTDAHGCTSTKNYGITQPDSLWVSGTVSQIKCYGDMDGWISVYVNGGAPGFELYLWSNGKTTNYLTGLGSGTYTVTVTDGVGCTATKTFELISPAQLTVDIVGVDSACVGEGERYQIAGLPMGFGYQWSASDNGVITAGQGTNTAWASWPTPGAKTLTAQFTDANGCTGIGTFTVNVDICSGTNEAAWAGVQVLPNPFTDFVEIAFSDGTHAGALLRLHDAQGRLLLEKTVDSERIRLETSQLPAGAYFLQMLENGRVAGRHLVKTER